MLRKLIKCALVLLFEARGTGFERISGGTADKGAFEILGPTAAGVIVSGRVTAGRKGVARALVYMTDQNGTIRTAKTNSSGYYTFTDVEAGKTYIFNVSARRYQFDTQVKTVSEDLDGLNFTAQTVKKTE